MTSPLKFLRETRDELMQVSFPTQKEVIRLTVVIILVSVVVGLYVGGIDFLLTKITELAIK